jgi:iron complex outermembrane receptor protein
MIVADARRTLCIGASLARLNQQGSSSPKGKIDVSTTRLSMIRTQATWPILCMAVAGMVAPTASSLAQGTNAERSRELVDEIIVTARKREEASQDVPVTMSVLSAELLEERHVSTINDLSNIAPNVTVHGAFSTPNVAVIYMRGFGSISAEVTGEPSIPTYIDGIYQAQLKGTMVDVFDLRSIEILKGPQSTVLGKNSPAGALSLTTIRPSGELGAKLGLDVGRFDRVEARGAFDFPVVEDKLAARVSVVYKHGGDFVKDLASGDRIMGGSDAKGARLGLLFTPTDAIEWYLTSSYVENTSPQQGARSISSLTSGPDFAPTPLICSLLSICTPRERYEIMPNFKEHIDDEIFDVTSVLDFDLQKATLNFTTGYKSIDSINNADVDGLPADILTAYDNDLDADFISQEIRLTSNKGGGFDFGGKLDWLIGAYYSKMDTDYVQPLLILGAPFANATKQTSKSYAVFAQAEFHVTDAWSISIGDRYTWDKKKYGFQPTHPTDVGPAPPFINSKGDWSDNSAEIGVSYKFDDHKMAFLRLAQGYRGGGFNPVIPAPGNVVEYAPETVESVELGVKTDWLDRTLRVNASFFYNEFDDLQRAIYKPDTSASSPSFLAVTANAASATTKGVELEILATPIDRLTARLNFGYLDAEYDDFTADVSGLGVETDNSHFRFPFSPKWNYSANLQWVALRSALGELELEANYAWQSSTLLNPLDDFPSANQDDYGLLDLTARFTTEDGRYSIALYGRNVANRHYKTAVDNGSNLLTVAMDGAPRTWGVSLQASF